MAEILWGDGDMRRGAGERGRRGIWGRGISGRREERAGRRFLKGGGRGGECGLGRMHEIGLQKKKACERRRATQEDSKIISFAGRFRAAGRAGRPAAPRISGPVLRGASRMARRERASPRRACAGGSAARCMVSGRSRSCVPYPRSKTSARAGGFRIPEIFCDTSREFIGAVARVGFSGGRRLD